MDDIRNWYLRLTAKFFHDNEIIQIKNISSEINGMMFPSFVIHLYMEMLCYSVERNGLIKIRNEYMAENNVSVMIADMFGFSKMQPLVKQALAILMNHGLVEIEEDFENYTTNIFLPNVVDNTGSTKLSSEQRQQRRLAAKKDKILKLENKEDKNVENESNEIKEKKQVYGCMENIYLTKNEYNSLSKAQGFKKILVKYSMEKAISHTLYNIQEDINDYEELKILLGIREERIDSDMEF